jgi:hypothetical protein
MSKSGSAPLNSELITNTMNELAHQIGIMEPDDPKRASYLKKLSALTQLRRFMKSAGDQLVGTRIDELARE